MTVRLLHQIGERRHGANFNTLDEILACDEPLHFDGVYQSVYANYQALKGKDVTFFITGDYLGKTNAFDIGQPLSRFCTIKQVEEMAKFLDARIGWHGKRHINCTRASAQHVQEELELPRWWDIIFKTAPILAWPYGSFDSNTVEIAERLGYTEAWSVGQGDGSQYALKRAHLNW